MRLAGGTVDMNRKFHILQISQFFTAREELVPIRHIFYTNISHFCEICARSEITCSIHAQSSHR